MDARFSIFKSLFVPRFVPRFGLWYPYFSEQKSGKFCTPNRSGNQAGQVLGDVGIGSHLQELAKHRRPPARAGAGRHQIGRVRAPAIRDCGRPALLYVLIPPPTKTCARKNLG